MAAILDSRMDIGGQMSSVPGEMEAEDSDPDSGTMFMAIDRGSGSAYTVSKTELSPPSSVCQETEDCVGTIKQEHVASNTAMTDLQQYMPISGSYESKDTSVQVQKQNVVTDYELTSSHVASELNSDELQSSVHVTNEVCSSQNSSQNLSQSFLKKRQKLHDQKLFQKYKDSLLDFNFDPSSSDNGKTPTGGSTATNTFSSFVSKNINPYEADTLKSGSEDTVDYLDDRSAIFGSSLPYTAMDTSVSAEINTAKTQSYDILGKPLEEAADVIPEHIKEVMSKYSISNDTDLENKKVSEILPDHVKHAMISQMEAKNFKTMFGTRRNDIDYFKSDEDQLSENVPLPYNMGDANSNKNLTIKDVPVVVGGKIFHCCNVCHKSFKTPKELRIHFRTHTNEKPFSCEVCGKPFRQRAHLTSHNKIHNGEKPYSCDLCGTSFTENSSLKRHLRNHFGIRPFKCAKCEEAFITSTALKAHIKRRHEMKNIETFSCPRCAKMYSCKESLKKHLRSHDPDTRITCSICSQVCLTQGHLKKHQRIHEVKDLNEEPQKEKPFECGVCHKSYVNKAHLEQHLLIHGDESPFKCNKCDFAFKSKGHLRSHVMSVHAPKPNGIHNDKPFQCELCDRRFRLHRYLLLHGQNAHSDQSRTFPCDVCSRTFTRNDSLTHHKMTHSGRKFECTLCTSAHSSPRGLRQHMHRKHSSDGGLAREYDCQLCEKKFCDKSSLKVHVSTKHAESAPVFSCENCNVQFSRKNSLQRHLKRHCPCLSKKSADPEGDVEDEVMDISKYNTEDDLNMIAMSDSDISSGKETFEKVEDHDFQNTKRKTVKTDIIAVAESQSKITGNNRGEDIEMEETETTDDLERGEIRKSSSSVHSKEISWHGLSNRTGEDVTSSSDTDIEDIVELEASTSLRSYQNEDTFTRSRALGVSTVNRIDNLDNAGIVNTCSESKPDDSGKSTECKNTKSSNANSTSTSTIQDSVVGDHVSATKDKDNISHAYGSEPTVIKSSTVHAYGLSQNTDTSSRVNNEKPKATLIVDSSGLELFSDDDTESMLTVNPVRDNQSYSTNSQSKGTLKVNLAGINYEQSSDTKSTPATDEMYLEDEDTDDYYSSQSSIEED